ncbi:hypothetical protein EH165_03595 [Nakamurella antarctica]|uniref:UPF0225 protein EH165_03595 n=1 Tax=Nakamurella antarctica TaxID=1902245 RepID=A0A3G8ZJJ9_9ACTN|nr:YchJ family metal-binding protein [Nakamurella antarctica]AZI57380.1 hypothetical protein EH165_03595 [Nakamurella antarctica]
MKQRQQDAQCPCGTGYTYGQCCGPLHQQHTVATTAEQLMRSRYSAFALGLADYLRLSWHSATRPAEIDLDARQRWTKLEILDTSGSSLLESAGTVRFRATYRLGRETGCLVENSRFAREGGQWRYVDAVSSR